MNNIIPNKKEYELMNKETQIKNILAFLTIFFGEEDIWFDFIEKQPPDYLIEKFERYVLSDQSQWQWGLHPSLRRTIFNRYCEKWELECNL